MTTNTQKTDYTLPTLTQGNLCDITKPNNF